MQLVLGIRELLCDHHCTLFFFLKPYVKATVHKKGGGGANIFPPGVEEKKIPTWGLSFYKKNCLVIKSKIMHALLQYISLL